MQKVADGHIMVQGHKHPRHHPYKGMDKEHLYEIAIKADFLDTEPEYEEGFRDCTRAYDKINQGKHGQEVAHGPVQGVLIVDEIEESTIPYHSHNIHGV